MSSIINSKRLEELKALDEDGSSNVLWELLHAYCESSPKKVKFIKDSLHSGNLSAAKLEAHSLRSTSINLGIDGVAQACSQIEYAQDTTDFTRLFLELENIFLKASIEILTYLRNGEGNLVQLSRIIQLQQEVATANLELPALMQLICEKTQEITLATGAVVELAEGDEMVYHAVSGSVSTHLGLRLRIDKSLSGESFTKNEVLYCMDTETDPRVDREACRKVKARSMICVPLINAGETIGVLKVLSIYSDKFSEVDANVLRLIAGLLSAAIAQADSYSKLIASERKFRTLVEATNDAIVVSKDGVILDINPTFEKYFGYTRKEAIGMAGIVLLIPEHRVYATQKVQLDPQTPYEARALRKDGSTFDIEAVGKNIEISGELIRVTTIRDITAKRMEEKNLMDSEKKSREATKAKSQFLANMSHEIRTPLNAIIGMSSLLEETQLDSSQEEYIRVLSKSAENLLDLVNDILDFSKIEAGKLEIEEIDFELRPIFNEVSMLFKRVAEKKGIHFNLIYEDNVPFAISSDPTRLRQILTNLISNAIKYTLKGGIDVRVCRLDGVIKVIVKDSGVGIPDDYLPNLFMPFSQADASNTRKFGGTGLGLSICSELVHLLGGEIGVQSKQGEGAAFWFTLPYKSSSLQKTIPNASLHVPALQHLKVLLVEDNDTNALIAKLMVEKIGHEVTVATNGREALRLLDTSHFDVILMDCQMPEMDGYETTGIIRKAKQTWNRIPIIAMTASAMKGDREKCLEAGMDEYLSKPIKKDEVAQVLNTTTKKILAQK